MSKWIKCPKCDINYIKDSEESCSVCNQQFALKKPGRKPGVPQGKTKRHITETMVAACYKYGKQYISKQITIDDAVDGVVNETGMNETSCKRMIYDSITGLFEGRKYTSLMSEMATFLLLKNIRVEFGRDYVNQNKGKQ